MNYENGKMDWIRKEKDEGGRMNYESGKMNGVRCSGSTSSPSRDCVATRKAPLLSFRAVARNLAFFATYKNKISPLRVEMTIATQSATGED